MRNRGPLLRSQICALILLWLTCAPTLTSADVKSLPKPTGYVSDLAHVVDPAEKQQLEEFCTAVEQQLGVQFALVTIDSLDDRPIRDFALDLARQWGVGSKKDNQGVLLLLAVHDHTDDIETGRGIEPYITDGFAGSTLRTMRPELRDSNYGAALEAAAQTMAQQIAQGKGIAFSATLPVRVRREPEHHGNGGLSIPTIIFAIFFLLWLLGRGGRRGGRGGGGGGFWTGILLGNLLGGGRGFGGGGGWGGGGGFGGGSGGSGGFGGFGGGDFGGGGASSNW